MKGQTEQNGKQGKLAANWRDNYYIGLDIGTTSVGWAVCDEQYNIPRIKGKRAWGVRLFEEADTAASRRAFRSARRRAQRQKLRLKYLRAIFAPLIDPIDAGFYRRLDDAFFLDNDKQVSQKNTLFNDADYTDADYHEDFPTIWHVRKYLIDLGRGLDPGKTPKKLDPRHYFLAIQHMLKNRGHFLFSGDFDITSSFTEIWDRFEQRAEAYGFYFTGNAQDGIKQLVSEKMTLNDKKRAAKDYLATDRMDEQDGEAKKRAENLLNLMLGSLVALNKVFDVEGEEKLEFKKGLEEQQDKLSALDEEALALVEAAKNLYDFGKLEDILDGETYLSDAVVKLYNTHKEHLALLKQVVPDVGAQRHFYHDDRVAGDKDITYVSYARGARSKNGKKHIRTNPEDFRKHCKGLVDAAHDSDAKSKLLELLDSEQAFMPLQKGFFQGVIPNQLHRNELKLILDALCRAYPDFDAQCTAFRNDPTAVPDTKKITDMLSFRYPYWAGPLGSPSDQNTSDEIPERQKAWRAKRVGRENDKVYPWNFSEVIDEGATATAFIERLTGKCTYLYDEPVLPKHSVIYQKYMVLNDLNSLRLDGARIDDVQVKQRLFDELFCARRNVSVKDIEAWFKTEIGQKVTIAIADADDAAGRKINSKMSTYHDFTEIFGVGFVENNEAQVEAAVAAITSLPDSRDLIRGELRRIFAAQLATGVVTKAQVEALSGKQYAGWGRLSGMLLNEMQAIDEKTGELLPKTILGELWDTNKTFMELVRSTGSSFACAIDWHNRDLTADDPRQFVLDSWASPPVKRAILQAYKIVEELIAIIGCSPAKVFVESTREEGSKTQGGRTTSRYRELYDILQAANSEVCAELEQYGEDEQALNNKRLYLYFTQEGKCAYCGRPLDLGRINSGDYDIDHIIPRSYLKDDSLRDNLVLVHRAENETKSNQYPLPPEFRQTKLWERWRTIGLISQRKLERLQRVEPLSEKDKEGFIARQLVETSQAVKLARDLLQLLLPEDTKVVLTKAGVASDFRREMVRFQKDPDGQTVIDERGRPAIEIVLKPEYVKCRELNDYHHAKDAYLAIVTGNVLHAKFTENPRVWFAARNDLGREENNLSKLFWHTQRAFGAERTVVWDTEQRLQTVTWHMLRDDCLVTRMLQDMTSKKRGLFDMNIVPAAPGKIPIKGTDNRLSATVRYGGWNSETFTCMVALRDGRTNRLVGIPTRYKHQIAEYIAREYPNARDGYEVLLFNSLVLRDGVFPCRLSGGRELQPDAQLVLSHEMQVYAKRVTRLCGTNGKLRDDNARILEKIDRVNAEDNNALYRDLIEKLENSVYQYHPQKSALTRQLSGDFNALSVEDQVRLLYELLKFFRADKPQSLNLKAIGGRDGDNRLRINSFGDMSDMVVTKQSITGLLEKRERLFRDV
ncbi:MAG: type II CRISPR RNA-guided endonuclease Cas9 [Actinomycetes bacterium]|jgi:CRISPR-associated endonuclease Csn1|nr:type II CRISPR RNA-guided endonuclease Cas9 [Actinomycetes bacterium]